MEKQNNQLSPMLVFFLVHSIQFGVGVLGFQRIIIENSGNDSWIAVLLAGLGIHIIIWIMYGILNKGDGDLATIHSKVFGKWLGGTVSFIWVIYWMLIAITILRTYIEVIQVWMFPKINVFVFALIFMIVVYYCVSGGLRIVAGICFLGVVIPFYLTFTFLFPLEYSHFRNLLPIWNHSFMDIAISTKNMTLSYLGFSTLFMYYPYIKDAKSSQKWAHWGHALTILIYLYIILISMVFYSEKQIAREVWATLTMWKIVEMPFVERFEYIGITSWALIILPNICLAIWSSEKAITRIFNLKQNKYVMLILVMLMYIVVISINGRRNIDLFNSYLSKAGFYLVFVYIPLFFLIYLIISKIRGKK